MNKDEYYSRLNRAIDYVEKNIHQKIVLADISASAFSSLSHFHRIFYFMTGFSLKEYIRRRRLSCAAINLISSDKTVMDIAFEAQFESPESFNKAFKKMFSFSPREFRKIKPEFTITRKLELNPEENLPQPQNVKLDFVFLPEQNVAGIKTHTTLKNNQQTEDIPEFFAAVMSKHLLREIPNQIDVHKIFGVYSNMNDEEAFDYTVGVLVSQLFKQNKYCNHILPTSEYARFTVQGDPSHLESVWRYIYGSWMPHSGRSRQKGLDFEIYFPDKTDIYIPMQPSK